MPQIAKIKIRRGLNAALPAAGTELGELRYSTDTKEFYIDDGTANVKIGGNPIGFPISTATQTALDLKAPLVSPALTGTPTAPTAAAATNTTQLATTAFVRTEVANLVNSAPGTLDTLGEIATQLASDESVAAALATTVSGKLAKASNLSDVVSVSTARTNLGLGTGNSPAFTGLSVTGSDVFVGTFNNGNHGGRVRLATDSLAYAAFVSETFDWTNGPVGEVNYSDHTFGLAYNSDWGGTKVVAGEVNMGLAFEPKFSQAASPFSSEVYYSWTDPTNLISIRPWGFVTAHATGDTTFTSIGRVNFFRHTSVGGAQCAALQEDGLLDLSFLSTGGILIKNNTFGIRAKNAAGSSTYPLIYLNSSDTIVIGSGQAISLPATTTVASIEGISTIKGNADLTTYIQFAGGGYVRFFSNNVQRMELSQFEGLKLTTGLVFPTDNTYDLGFYPAGPTNMRPRTIYAGTSVVAPVLTASTSSSLGIATATSFNKWILTAPTTAATLVAGGDNLTYTFPSTSATIARTDAANTFTGHQTIEGVTSTGATGTGKFVFDTSPTLVTPILGVASATSIAVANGSASAPPLRGGDADSGIYFVGNNTRVTLDSTPMLQIDGGGIVTGSTRKYSWTDNNADGSVDTNLSKESPGVVRVGTTAANALGKLDCAEYQIAGTKVIGARGAALTAANAGTINSGDGTTDTIIANMRTRINELEARLSSAAGHGLFT